MRVEQHTRVNVTVAVATVADATVGYGQFKRVAPPRRCGWLICVTVVVSEERRRTRQSTLVKYLQLIGPVPEVGR